MAHQILEGKKGIIFGALDDQSIAWKTAESVADAGGTFVLTNAPVAMRMGDHQCPCRKNGFSSDCSRCGKNGRSGSADRAVPRNFRREN